VQDHHVAVDQHALDHALRIRKFLAPVLDELLEALDAVGGIGIVLDVVRPEVLRRRLEVLVVEGLDYGLMVR
jgi:hypothetical protein